MADRNAEQVTSAGLEPTAHPASGGGDTIPPDVFLRVINGGGSPVTLTIVTPGTVDGDLAIEDRQVTVAAGTAQLVRVPRVPYRNPSTGRVDLQWSDTTGVTFEVVR